MLKKNASGKPRAALYARCSTWNGQDPEVQLRELRAYVEQRGWTSAGEYVDQGISGTKDRRPELDRLMADARRRRFDVVLVWRFDRFARSLRHLVLALDEFQSLGLDFVSLTEAIDTSTPIGRAMFAIVGALGEVERSAIVERVRAGIAKAKACGKKLGRPAALLDLDAARARLGAGESLRAVAKAIGVHHATLGRALARSGAETHVGAPLASAS